MTNPSNKFYPCKRGKVHRANSGAWRKQILALTKPLDKAIEDIILQLHNKRLTIEEIAYVVNTCAYHAIAKYSMLGKVVKINPRKKQTP